MNNMPKYTAIPSHHWAKINPNIPGPARVSIYGALPSPASNYRIVEGGWSIRDNRAGTVSNYFFGKIGIATEAEANAIIARLVNL